MRIGKILKVVVGSGLAAMSLANAEVKVNDNFSMMGFLDMATYYVDSAGEWNTTDASLDQFELDFKYDFKSGTTAQVDLNSLSAGAVGLEQAFVTQALGPVSLTAGKFLSSTGFEAAEPTGMYQNSYSKNMDQCATGGPHCVYGGYQNGFALNYGQEKFNLYGSLVGSVWTPGKTDLEYPGFEIQGALMPMKEVTVKVAYAMDIVKGAADPSLINAWASYTMGAIMVAGEFNYLTNWVGYDDGMGWLAMGRYTMDKIGITLRYSGIILGDDDPDTEITLSPSYAINSNFGVLAEFKRELDTEMNKVAVEGTFVF